MDIKKTQNIKKPEAVAGIASLRPYKQGQSKIGNRTNPIKLSSNESNLGASPKAIKAYKEYADQLFRYPEGSQRELTQAIGERFGLNPQQIICGNGSDELILLLIRAYTQPNDEIIISEYSFVMAKIHARIHGANVIIAPEPELKISVDEILSRLTPRTKMIIVANPNNPIGQYISADEIKRLHENLPSDVLFVLDGAYADYVEEADFDDGAKRADEHGNIVITRTFSKLYGLAGLRIGWAYAPPNIIDTLQRIRTPFNTNGAALAAATEAVQDKEYADFVRQHNAKWLRQINEALTKLGLTMIKSVTNFYLIRFDEFGEAGAEKAWEFLLQKNIIARPISASGPPNCLRLTIGRDEENQAVIQAFTEFAKIYRKK